MDFGYFENQVKQCVQHLLGKSSGPGVRDWHHKTPRWGRALRGLEEKLKVEAIQEKLCAVNPTGRVNTESKAPAVLTVLFLGSGFFLWRKMNMPCYRQWRPKGGEKGKE